MSTTKKSSLPRPSWTSMSDRGFGHNKIDFVFIFFLRFVTPSSGSRLRRLRLLSAPPRPYWNGGRRYRRRPTVEITRKGRFGCRDRTPQVMESPVQRAFDGLDVNAAPRATPPVLQRHQDAVIEGATGDRALELRARGSVIFLTSSIDASPPLASPDRDRVGSAIVASQLMPLSMPSRATSV